MNQQHTSPLRRLLIYAEHHRRRIWLASLCSILNKIFDLAPPLLIGAAVNVVVAQENSFLGDFIANTTTQLWFLAGLTVIIWSGESAFQYAYAILWRNLAQTLQHELRLDTYAHVQQLELAYFEDNSTGGLMSVLNNDINQLERFLDVGANYLWQVITTMVVVGTLFIVSAPSVSWMAVLPMPFVVWGSLRFQKRLAPLYTAVREQVGSLNGYLSNNLSGIATIKSFTAEAHENERIRHESEAYRQRNQHAIQLSAAFVPLIRMVIAAGFTAILLFGGQLVLEGALDVGLYSVLVFMTQRLLWPLTSLGETLDLYQRAMASSERIFHLLDTIPQIVDGEQRLMKVAGDVTFDNVTFQYEQQMMAARHLTVIHGLQLRVPAGHTAAIVGSTGAGKSTVVKLLLRFYDVSNGRICIDGQDIRQVRLRDLRQAIGFVSQDVFLFHGTVRENITYGTFGASMAEIEAAAKVAEAHDFIMELPNGYETIVGERGQKLSGGQRQRLSIARAVLKDPPILILDEATSAVDNETEAAIQRSMARIIVGRTTIVIAHRLSTIRNADEIFVLDKGRLVEQGRHDALVQQGGIYATLWRVQTGER